MQPVSCDDLAERLETVQPFEKKSQNKFNNFDFIYLKMSHMCPLYISLSTSCLAYRGYGCSGRLIQHLQ